MKIWGHFASQVECSQDAAHGRQNMGHAIKYGTAGNPTCSTALTATR